MPFKTAGGQENIQAKSDDKDGLPSHWDNLQATCCPRCADELVYFEHINLWKCICGFKIGDHRMQEILSDMDRKDSYSGFGIGDYTDEPPF